MVEERRNPDTITLGANGVWVYVLAHIYEIRSKKGERNLKEIFSPHPLRPPILPQPTGRFMCTADGRWVVLASCALSCLVFFCLADLFGPSLPCQAIAAARSLVGLLYRFTLMVFWDNDLLHPAPLLCVPFD